MLNALGLAFTQMSNTYQSMLDGGMSVRVHQWGYGLWAIIRRYGKQKHNWTSQHYRASLASILGYEQNRYDREFLLADLGKEFLITRVADKLYSFCKGTHIAIEAILELRKEYNIAYSDIDKVTVYVSKTFTILSVSPSRGRKNR